MGGRDSAAPAFWIRLTPPRPRGAAAAPAGGALLPVLQDLLGCRWLLWAPDARDAWSGLFTALGTEPDAAVFTSFGADAAIDDAARERGARRRDVDVDPRSGRPAWPSNPPRDAVLCVLDHPYGMPVAPPPVLDTSMLLEDATGAVGATVDGRTVGSLGRAAVLRLGAAPFARSTGALVSSNDGSLVERLEADPRYQHPSAAGAGLWADAGLVQEWIEGCRAAAGVYDSVWRGAGLPVGPLESAPRTEPTYSSYLVSVPDAGALALTLAARGVETCRPLAAPITHAGKAAVEFPGAVAFHRTALQLPNHPDLGLGELLYVADAVCAHLRGLVQDSGR